MRQPGLVYATRRPENHDELDVIAGTFSIYSIPYFALLDNGFTYSYVTTVVSRGLDILVENVGVAVIIQSLMGNLVEVSSV